jgi:hypothetical protein
MKFDDHEPNFFESDAHAVPSPHHRLSRAARVALTSLVTARRRLSRFTHSRRIRRRAASVSPLSSPARSMTCLMPMLVPRANSTSSRRRRRVARSMISREATEVNSSVNPVR